MKKTATQIACVASVLCLIFVLCTTIKAEDAITLKVTPTVYGASKGGTQSTIFIRITPNPKNRKLTLEWDSDTGDYGSSEMELDGENAPKVIDSKAGFGSHVVFYSGNYVVKVMLTRSDGQTFLAQQTVSDLIADQEAR